MFRKSFAELDEPATDANDCDGDGQQDDPDEFTEGMIFFLLSARVLYSTSKL